MRINFYLDKKHPDTKDEVLIFLYAHFEGKRFKVTTGERCNPKTWDPKIDRLKPFAKGAQSLNDLLDSMEEEVKKVYREARMQRIQVSVEYIKENLSFIRKKELSFFDLWDKFVKSESTISGWVPGTVKRFNTAKKHLLELNKDYKIEFSSINDNFLQRFILYHQDKGYSNPFTDKNIKILKWFLNWATQKKYNTNIDYQAFKPKLKKPSDQDNIIYLTIGELAKVYNLSIDRPGLEQVRDIFVFGCFTGLRYSDLHNLKKSDIRNDNIHLTTIKTGRTLKIPLNQYASAILKKYKDYPGPKVLPVISNQKYNDHLKTLGQLCDLDDLVTIINYSGSERTETVHPKWSLLTSHVSRKTFITLGVYFDIPLEVMIEYTGQTIEVVRRYYQIQDKQKEREMKKFNKMRIVS